jgi:YfiR/HmsC-like
MAHNSRFARTARVLGYVLAVAVCLAWWRNAPVQAQTIPSEGAVKTALIFNFLKFIQWPSNAFSGAGDAIVLCVRTGSDLDGPLALLANRVVQNRTIRIRQVSASDGDRDCHVSYYGANLTAAPGAPDMPRFAVTIGDTPRFAQTGGMVNFYREDGRLRFEINTEAARQAELRFSAELLRLARIVAPEAAR